MTSTIEFALTDSVAASLLARETGVQLADVYRLLAALGRLPEEQRLRMTTTAADRQAREERRAKR